MHRLARACPPPARRFPELQAGSRKNSCFPARAIESAKRLRSAQLPGASRLHRRWSPWRPPESARRCGADAHTHTLSPVGRSCARARRARRARRSLGGPCVGRLSLDRTACQFVLVAESPESRAPDTCSHATGQGATQGRRRRRRRPTACRGRGRRCAPTPPCPSAARTRLATVERFVRAGKHGGGRAPLPPARALAAHDVRLAAHKCWSRAWSHT